MIILEAVTKKFGQFHALESLSFRIDNGELYGFLGPNGAGKTTTVKMTVGLLKPTSGTITVDGFNVSENPMDVKEITGYIPDTPYVYPQLTMREYLDFIEDIYDLNGEQAENIREEYYEKFNLSNWHQDLVQNLSHGMKQKMLFTAIFMMEPSVIVIDEPMVGLDPESARVMKTALRYEVEQRNTTILLSTHSLEVAQDICDRVGIIRQGALIAEGTYESLRNQQDETLEEIFLRVTREKTSSSPQ